MFPQRRSSRILTDIQEKIRSFLPQEYPWKDILSYVPQTDSTNNQLKELAKQGAPHGTVLIAGCQTGGRGRLGRSFSSPENMGIYLSILLRPECLPRELMLLTCSVGIAMCDAIEVNTGLRPKIKWINDLVWEKKKIGGILVELGLRCDGYTDYAIAGIGINCRQKQVDFPTELQDKATSLEAVTGHSVNMAELTAEMAVMLWKMSRELLDGKREMLCRYRKDCITLGQDVSFISSNGILHGVALDIDEQGALVVQFSNHVIEHVNAGEVSIRGMYGYV